jgi:Tfp pilus assembly protein PilO
MIKKFIPIILILIFAAIVVFLNVPGVQKILDIRKQIDSSKQTFVEEQELMTRVENLVKLYEDNKESVEKINYIIPSGEDIPNLIVQLEALAFEQGLVLGKIEMTPKETVQEGGGDTQQEKSVENYKTLTINVSIMGTYDAFKNYLKAVEENMRLMDVNSLNFSSKSKGEEEVQEITPETQIFDFDLIMNTYYQ